jgi:hypothetical protein
MQDKDEVYVMPAERLELEVPEVALAAEKLETAGATEPVDDTPLTLDDVIMGLKGFGLEENEEILTFVASGKTVKVRIANIPTEQEMEALIAVEGYKGYTWIQRVRCEILSRSITWINGMSIRDLPDAQRVVIDPTDGKRKDVQVALRNILMGWGQELLGVLWKILMVHSDKIEKRLKSSFPEADLTTDIERRFFEAALKEVEDTTREVLTDTVAEALDAELSDEDKSEFTQLMKQGIK